MLLDRVGRGIHVDAMPQHVVEILDRHVDQVRSRSQIGRDGLLGQ